MTRAPVLPVLAAILFTACSSTPTRFYTLVPSAPAASAGPAAERAAYFIDVQDVRVPQQVDIPQFVLRQSDGEVAVVESRQWIAPLPEEIRNSVAQNLARRLGTIDVHAQGAGRRKLPVYGVQLDVTRFDSVLGRESRLEATWIVSAPKQEGAPLRCTATFARAAGADYETLVAAHQSALDALSAQIAAAIGAGAATCP